MIGILGTPMIRGKSDSIEAATYAALVVAGAGVSQTGSSNGDGQLTVKPFAAASGLAGFAVANDLNEKNQTVSVVKTALDLPIAAVAGKVFVAGKGVFLDASGLAVPEGDATAVYQVNGTVRRISFTGLDNKSVEKPAITIDFFGGGAPFSPA